LPFITILSPKLCFTFHGGQKVESGYIYKEQ